MIRQPEPEQLKRLTVKTLDRVIVMRAKEGSSYSIFEALTLTDLVKDNIGIGNICGRGRFGRIILHRSDPNKKNARFGLSSAWIAIRETLMHDARLMSSFTKTAGFG